MSSTPPWCTCTLLRRKCHFFHGCERGQAREGYAQSISGSVEKRTQVLFPLHQFCSLASLCTLPSYCNQLSHKYPPFLPNRSCAPVVPNPQQQNGLTQTLALPAQSPESCCYHRYQRGAPLSGWSGSAGLFFKTLSITKQSSSTKLLL